MLTTIKIECSILLVCLLYTIGMAQLADPEFIGAGASTTGEVYEVLPDTSFNHYLYPPPRPPRLRLVKKPANSKTSSPLQAVQKVFVAKPAPAHGGYPSMAYTMGAVALALISQAVGTIFFMVLAKLVLGMKAVLATNTATLALTLWTHLKKKKKLKLKKHVVVHKPVKKRKKNPHGQKQWLQLTKKQLKKIIKLLSKKKKIK